MKILIAEDDLISRKFIQKFLSAYGECDVTSDGVEVVEAFIAALDSGEYYDLICLDVMMPRVDGIKALKTIRELEVIRSVDGDKRAKIIVTTALAKVDYIINSFETGMEEYVSKPIELEKMETAMKRLGLI